MCLAMGIGDATAAPGGALTTLEPLRWGNRVILVFAPPELSKEAVNNLESLDDAIRDRDIAWFVLTGVEMKTNYTGRMDAGLRTWIVGQYFTPTPGSTAVVLIGKDGGVKSRGEDLDLEATFGLIDSMPMRQAEMRRDSQN